LGNTGASNKVELPTTLVALPSGQASIQELRFPRICGMAGETRFCHGLLKLKIFFLRFYHQRTQATVLRRR